MINRIVEKEMTRDEQINLTLLEDEVAQAIDEAEFARIAIPYDEEDHYVSDMLVESSKHKLDKYIAEVTIAVLARMKQFE